MSETAIRAGIKTIIEGVSGIGPVHDYERIAESIAAQEELLTDTNKIVNGCMICFVETTFLNLNMPVVDLSHIYEIHFIREVDDANASSNTFNAVLHAAFLAIARSININDAAMKIDSLKKTSDTIDIGKGQFHYGIIDLVVWDREFYT
jgi:hypothetical protein